MRHSSPFSVEFIRDRLAEWRERHALPPIQLAKIPLCQDMVTFLTFVGSTRIIGTSSAGNMPLKAVREVAPLLSKPPELEIEIGGRIYQRRSEQDVWPLYFLHILAEVGRLVHTGRSRRWRLTADGERFLEMEPDVQLVFTLAVWWHRVNWLVAYPFAGMGENLPYGFSAAALAHLDLLPTGIETTFRGFADRLLDSTGLVWAARESALADELLRGSIERMIIDVLVKCEAVECRYKTKTSSGFERKVLTTIRLTPLGRALLEAVARCNNAALA